MNEAKNKARAIIERAEADAREIVEDMQDEVKNLEQVYKEFEKYRDNLISELKNLSNDTLERIEKLKKQVKYEGVDTLLKKSKDLARAQKENHPEQRPSRAETSPEPEVQDSQPSEPERNNQEDKSSFFDQIGSNG